MDIDWLSRQGNTRKSNNDAVAIGVKNNKLIIVIMDAAEKGINPIAFSKHWTTSLTHTFLNNPDLHSEIEATQLLRERHKILREQHFRLEVASFCLVEINLNTLEGNTLWLGDCRIGTLTNHEVQWINKPHNLLSQHQVTAIPNELHNPHLLTRSLKARRFQQPDFLSFALEQTDELHLSTDGYWREHLEENTHLNNCEDDASRLTVRNIDHKSIKQTNEAFNFFLIN
jgi:serine/threonine protein phosphatase PrpC